MIVADLSGGKDSIAMGLRLVELGERVDAFVFVDTGLEFPEAYEAIARFRQVTGREVEVVRAEQTFEWFATQAKVQGKRKGTMRREKGYGWPSFAVRWCNGHLKRIPLRAWDLAHGMPTHLIGIAADEPKRVRQKPRVRYPLVEWGWKEADCLAYCRERGFFQGDFYDKHKRMGCFVCPLQSVGDARYLRDHRPALWGQIKRLEAAIGEPWKGCGTERFDREVQHDDERLG